MAVIVVCSYTYYACNSYENNSLDVIISEKQIDLEYQMEFNYAEHLLKPRSHPTVNHNNKRHEENYEEEVWVTNHKLTDWTKFRENYTKLIGYPPQITNRKLKFMFSTKATKIDEIFTVDLTL